MPFRLWEMRCACYARSFVPPRQLKGQACRLMNFGRRSCFQVKRKYVEVDGQGVVVFNIGGEFYATQSACTHAGGPLDQGTLDGKILTCPISPVALRRNHRPGGRTAARRPLKTYQVTVLDKVGRVREKLIASFGSHAMAAENGMALPAATYSAKVLSGNCVRALASRGSYNA